MRKSIRILGVVIAAALAVAAAGCSGTPASVPTGEDPGPGPAATGSVYFLNFKPEVAEIYDSIVAAYKAETGIEVKVVTAASGTYQQTLTAEVAKSSPPTIFQINGPVGYATWRDYTADLTNSAIYQHLSDKSLAISANGGVFGVPYVVEGFGIIYNESIMAKYFALENKAVSIGSTAEINSFALLKQVVEDMTKLKGDLGIKGVFSSTSLKPGEDWRWQTHLANVPFFYEFKDAATDLTKGTPPEVAFKYSPQMQQLFDLYLNNSPTDKAQLGAKTVDDAMAEFALGQTAMVQNGNWAWNQISQAAGNIVQASDVKFMPIYIGAGGEESQGLCVGTENYFAINSEVSEADQKASLDFLEWMFSSATGKQFVTNELGFIAPFDWFGAADGPTDPLAQEVLAWMAKDGVSSVAWSAFMVFPSQDWKNAFGADLLSYAQGKMDWATISTRVVDSWKTEAAMAAEG